MLIDSDDGYVIHSRPFSDSRILLKLFTPKAGIISALYRLPSKKYTFRPKPFEPIAVCFRGKSQLKTLTSLEPTGTAIHLVGRRLFCGLYVNELLERLIRIEENSEKLFDIYQNTLMSLATHSEYTASLRLFELFLLSHLGYAPDYSTDIYGDAIDYSETAFYRYQPEQGFQRQHLYQNTPDVFSGKAIQVIDSLNWQLITHEPSVKRFCRLALKPLLGNKPLKARSLFKK